MLPVLLLLACARPCGDEPPDAAGDQECRLPGFAGRNYLLHLPTGWKPATAVPVVLAIHGGGGRKESMVSITCADGSASEPSCLNAVADREGFAVVYPDGTPGLVGRTWNAGGGDGDWRCVSGKACKDGVDDLAYFDALVDDLDRVITVDRDRVYATGLSNGAAMSHRLACERSERFAAIAPVAGGNQLAADQGCEPERTVPVLQIHGTADPCWSYTGGSGACIQKDGSVYVSVEETMDAWAAIDVCGSPNEERLPDVADDGTLVTRVTWDDCVADVQHLRIEGGGHTWPGGDQYLKEATVGKVSQDIAASDEIWAFFADHPMTH